MERAAIAFKEQRFHEAIALYSEIITTTLAAPFSDTNKETLTKAYSNRSASHAMLAQFSEALTDAEQCTKMSPNFAKGWARLASAFHGLKRYGDAAAAYREAAMRPDRQGAADAQEYATQALDMDKLVETGRGVVGQEDRDKYYVTKYSAEGIKASKAGNQKEAIEFFTKAIKHERQSMAFRAKQQQTASSSNKSTTPELCVLLCNRSAALLKLAAALTAAGSPAIITTAVAAESSKHFKDSLEDAEESVSLCSSYARGHARVVLSLVALKRLRSARRALDDAKETLQRCSSSSSSSASSDYETALAPATAALEKAEKDAEEKELAAQRELQRQEQEFQEAKQSRNNVGDHVSVDELKKRKVEDGAAGGGGGGASIGSKFSSSYQYCRFCSGYGHSAAMCPLKQRR